jgi:RsiW-degrading membrane proteinase PrsW (M82 family)
MILIDELLDMSTIISALLFLAMISSIPWLGFYGLRRSTKPHKNKWLLWVLWAASSGVIFSFVLMFLVVGWLAINSD